MTDSNKRGSEPPVVFILVGKDSSCSECGKELYKGSFLYKEGDRGLCLECADMDHLIFLPSGDATLTRRSGKLSKLKAVVLQWSRARKRYERQGILVEENALHQAEEACLNDKDLREARRIRDLERRERLDLEYIGNFAQAVSQTYPGCPAKAAQAIAEHACLKYSGRVGRSAAAKQFDREAVELAVTAYVRHNCTKYDHLLMRGYDRYEAREEIRGDVEEKLYEWSRILETGN